MKYFLAILWFLIFTKLFVFWLWLWQLKEYHFGRFKAYFETQRLRKLFFSLHGIRYPKLTKKMILILLSGIVLEIFFLSLTSNLIYLLIALILAPVFTSILVLLFQILTRILIRRTLNKAKKKREQFKDLIVIGIAGSYGKTAVKEFLYEILSEKFKVLKTQKNINAEIGIARTILNELDSSHQVLIVEIGAYQRGKIKQVCHIIKPRVGILTGINEQHLSTFRSLENIKKAKYEIIECLPEKGISIIKDKLDLRATSIMVEKEFVSFKINDVDFKVNLLGRHNIENILLAVSSALKLGMKLEDITRACLKIKPEQGAMKIIKKGVLTILDASYSANPTGVIADLNYLNIYHGKKIIVMPCLIELGRASKEIHKRIGDKIAQVCDLAIITTKDYFLEIKQGRDNIILMENKEEIIKKLKETSEGVILLEGRIPHLIWD